MKRSIKKIVLGLVFGAMLVPSSYAWAKTGKTNTAGQWKMEEKHWTFLNEQGNKLTGWIVSNEEWYYLGENGNMKTGWLLDNGKWYFLSTEISAKTGRALTGWQWIDGYCYFFSTVDDNSLGILYVNRMTPDGYHVNQSGQWIDEKGEAYYIAGKGFASKQVAGASRPIPETAAFSGSSTGVNPGRGSSGSGGASLGTPETKQLKPEVPEKVEEKKPDVPEKVEEKKQEEKQPQKQPEAVEEKKPEEKKPEAVEEKKPDVPEEVEDKKLEEIPQNLVLAHKKNEFYELYYLYFGKRKYNDKIHSYIEKVNKVEINGTVYDGVAYGFYDRDVDFAERKNSFSKIAEGAETESKVNALVLTKDAFKEGESNKIVIRAEGYKDYEGTLASK
ncbi:hemoblobin-interacting domain-containing protein [Oribacterium parvum]|uniref:hemoblobin-interacting domain-containing protein n=1 Tax=Oribacterium parvum TaxID=1501329 RepID=UPI0028DCF57C|nr:hemoblobin-interacting domain-containing protein [Oribacterium parvum]